MGVAGECSPSIPERKAGRKWRNAAENAGEPSNSTGMTVWERPCDRGGTDLPAGQKQRRCSGKNKARAYALHHVQGWAYHLDFI